MKVVKRFCLQKRMISLRSITSILLLDFGLMLVSWMFTLSYTIIYFYIKKFIFSNVYISVITIFKCLYMFFGWERYHQLNKYVTVRTIHLGQGDFSVKKLVLFFQSWYLLILFPAEVVALIWCKSKTWDDQQLNAQVFSRIAEQFKT